jgi:hypothetical protein
MSALDLSRLHRVIVGSPDSRAPERVAFVEAIHGHAALKKVAAAIAALECRSPSAVEERLYNIQSAEECVEQGISDDVELRVFETGWNGHAPTYVEEPLFLVAAPAALIRAWSRCPHENLLRSLGDTRR